MTFIRAISLSLLNKVVRVSECPSTLQVPGCPSAQVSWLLEYSSALQVSFECPSVQLLFECSSARVPWVPKRTWSALGVLKCPLSALRVKKVCNITRNGLLNSFISINVPEYMFYITVIVLCFLGNKMPKF